ncbi:MAG: EAL domain-containing protein [Alphaproteobacteria bacterium]
MPNLRPQPLYDQNAFDDVDEVAAQAATAAEAAAEESDIKTLRSLVTQLYSGKSARKSAEKTTPRHAETFKNDPPRFKNAQAEMTQPAERVKPATPRLSKSLSEEELLTKINDSITQKRISILLQPVASLPGRHILFQECFTRLYDEDGMEIGPERFLAVAVSQGLMPTIDQLSLYFLLEYLTKIVNRQENNSYFCNISAHTIGNPVFFKAFLSQLEANPSVTAKLIIEISQTDIEQGGVALLQSIKNLKQVGFRLSMDQVFHAEHGIDLALRLGFDFIKLRAPTLMVYLDNSYQSRDDANQAVKQWQNQGLAIIAERVESEIALKELSEYDVNFAQGYLLGPPVKME